MNVGTASKRSEHKHRTVSEVEILFASSTQEDFHPKFRNEGKNKINAVFSLLLNYYLTF